MTFKNVFKLSLSVLIAGFCIWFILSRVNFQDFKISLSSANITWLLSAAIFFFVGYAFRIQRWRLILKLDRPSISWQDCAGPLLASFAMNNVVPFRAGDVLRAFAFNKKLKTTSGVVIASLFIERFFDFFVLVLLLFLISIFFHFNFSILYGLLFKLSLGLILLIFLIILFIPNVLKKILFQVERYLGLMLPQFAQKISKEINQIFLTIEKCRGYRITELFLWSILAWISEGIVFYLTAISFPTLIYPQASLATFPLSTLSTLIPGTPGYIGTFDYFVIQSMAHFGNNIVSSTAYAFILHIILWLPLTMIGGIYFYIYSVRHHS